MCSPEVWEHSQAHALKCLSPPLPHEENALVQEPPLQQDWTHTQAPHFYCPCLPRQGYCV